MYYIIVKGFNGKQTTMFSTLALVALVAQTTVTAADPSCDTATAWIERQDRIEDVVEKIYLASVLEKTLGTDNQPRCSNSMYSLADDDGENACADLGEDWDLCTKTQVEEFMRRTNPTSLWERWGCALSTSNDPTDAGNEDADKYKVGMKLGASYTNGEPNTIWIPPSGWPIETKYVGSGSYRALCCPARWPDDGIV